MTDMAFTQHTVALDSGPVTYLKGGEGRPILHLHPAGGPRVTPAMRLLARKHTLYIPTTPGFNGTPEHASVASMPALADLAAQFARTVIGPGPHDVVAESFGGYEALWLAARHPDLIEQMVLQAPAGLRPDGSDVPPADPEAFRRLLYAVPERAPAEMRSAEVIAGDNRQRGRYFAGITFDKALQAALPSIKARTLVLFGTADKIVPIETARTLLTGIRGARLTYIWGAAHVPEYDQPERTARIIGAFMELGEGYLVRRPA
jgi:pimeloyl-ACP methyl ester carboxylesterase